MKIFLLLLSIAPLWGQAQDSMPLPFPLKANKIYYERQVKAPSRQKNDLYRIAKVWGDSVFSNQQNALVTDDNSTGNLVYRFYFTSPFDSLSTDTLLQRLGPTYWQDMKLYVANGKAKIIIEGMHATIEAYSMIIENYWGEVKKMNEEAIADTKQIMSIDPETEKKMHDNTIVYQHEFYKNFQVAHKRITALLNDLEKTLTRTGK